MRHDFVTTFRSRDGQNRRETLIYRGRPRTFPEKLSNMG